jgi:hypothetical protein
VQSTTSNTRPVVSADGTGIVSHAGAALLRELADESGLTDGWTAALIDTYKGLPVHLPGRVLADLAVTLADGGDCLADLAGLRDQAALFGPVASHPTSYRVLDRVGTAQLELLRAARADARARVWVAGGGPDLTDPAGLILDVDATLLTAHSDKQDAAPTYKHGFGFHPLLVFLDRPDVSGGEALAGILRPGNAGSNTAADHLTVLDLALEQLPEHTRPTPSSLQDQSGPQVLIRADSAGATRAFLAGCRQRGVRYSVGLAVDPRIQDAVTLIPVDAWQPAISTDGTVRDNGEIVELTELLDLSAWPAGSRVICRRERPHPGAQYRFTDIDGHRFQVLLPTPRAAATTSPPSSSGTVSTPASKTGSATARTAACGTCPARTGTPTPPGSNSPSPQPTSRPGPKPCASPAPCAGSNPSGSATAPCTSRVGSSAPDGA